MKQQKCRKKEKKKEKKKKKKWRCARRSNHTRSRLPRDPGRHARPRLPRTTCVLSLQPLFLGFFFFFSSLMNTYSSLMNEYFQELLLLLSLWFFLLLSLLWFSLCCFQMQRLDFHVDAMWKKCHIRRKQPIKIESQKLDLQTLN